MNASIYAIAAMTGCMRWESSLNPNIWESNDPQTWDTIWHRNAQGNGVGGYGLGQWTNTRESGGRIAWRLRDFKDWCDDNNLDITHGDTQLQYIVYENVWFNVAHYGSNARTLTEFLETDSTDLDGLTRDFLANWEGVPDDHLSERIAFAHEHLDYLIEHAEDAPVDWAGTDSTWIISRSDSLNNALRYFQFFNGVIPPVPPTPTGKRKKMPLWFYMRRF